MNSFEFKKELDLLKGAVIKECRKEIEAIASEKFPVEKGYKQIVLTFPLYDLNLCTPIFVNSCFDGEANILIRRINCFPEGMSVGCHYIDEKNGWKANIAEECMHEKDLINILALIERMRILGNVYEHLHVRY